MDKIIDLDEIKVAVRFQCNKYDQKFCSGFHKKPMQSYCIYGLYERICHNKTLRAKYFIKECDARFFKKGHNCNKEICQNKECEK